MLLTLCPYMVHIWYIRRYKDRNDDDEEEEEEVSNDDWDLESQRRRLRRLGHCWVLMMVIRSTSAMWMAIITMLTMVMIAMMTTTSMFQEVQISCCNEDGCNGRPKPRWRKDPPPSYFWPHYHQIYRHIHTKTTMISCCNTSQLGAAKHDPQAPRSTSLPFSNIQLFSHQSHSC